MNKISIIDDLNLSRKNDIVLQNEISANKFLSICNLLFSVANVLVIILCVCKVYIVPNESIVFISSGVNIACLLIAVLISYLFKFKSWWIKYLLVGISIATFSVLNLIMTFYYSMGLIWALPIVLSIRYYNHKFTLKMIIVDFILFTLTNLLGTYFVVGIIDFEYCIFIPGTVINDDTTIEYMLAHIDRLETLKNSIIIAIIPMLIISVFFAFFNLAISKSNNVMLETNYRYVKEIVSTEEELKIAGKIQQNMLPKRFDELNLNKHFKVMANIYPAKQTGGDFYDIFTLNENKLAILVADVSGKGVPAALFMVKSKTTIKDCILSSKSLKEALKKARASLYDDNSDLFVTVWVGILDLKTGKLTYVNAGHNYPIVIPKKKDLYILKNKPQPFLNPYKSVVYEELTINLKKGDRIFIYTDGVTEAINNLDVMFGVNNLINELTNCRNNKINECLTNINQAIKIFTKNEEQFDDVTMLMLEYCG